MPVSADSENQRMSAVATDEGVLLFSDSVKGMKERTTYLQYLADGFFNFSKKVKTLKLYEIEIPMRQMVELADNCIDKLSKADLRRDDIQLRKSVCSFTPEKMAGKEMLIGAVCTGKYDLRPDFNNFDRLTKDFDLGISPRNYDVAALLYISENGYAGLMEADHFHPFSYQYEFKELAEKLGDSMKARREAPLSAHDFGYVALQMVMHLHDCTNRLAMIKRPYVPTIITRLYPLISMTIWNMKRKEVFLCQTMNLKLRTITMIILSYRILIKHLKRQLQR
ncbi:DUF6047 family protein [Bacteroides salyersiae]|uniref:DUF6047 family protein n=3 Tax=Bacteroides salyersiae TaxID=291644 RepID=UPI001CCBA394